LNLALVADLVIPEIFFQERNAVDKIINKD